MGPSQDPIALPPLNGFIASVASNMELLRAIHSNRGFTSIAYKWCVAMAKSNVLDQAIGSLGQTRPVVETLPALHQEKSDVALRQDQAPIPLDNEIDFLAAKEWLHRQEVNKAYEKLGEENGKDDIPETTQALKQQANEFSVAAMNEVGMVDLEYHREGKNQKVNYMVQRKRNLSTLDIALFGWEVSRAVRDTHLGLRGGSSIAPEDLQAYGSSKNRSDALKELFRVSKASVINTYALPCLDRFAANPTAELQRKRSNQKTNENRPVAHGGLEFNAATSYGQATKRGRDNDDGPNHDSNIFSDLPPAEKKARLDQGQIAHQLPLALHEDHGQRAIAQQAQLPDFEPGGFLGQLMGQSMPQIPQQQDFQFQAIQPGQYNHAMTMNMQNQENTQAGQPPNDWLSNEYIQWWPANMGLPGRPPFAPEEGSASSEQHKRDDEQ
ncbi:hypothetical protein B0T20DRAFT_350538 [Sordaria brevicollis]|uniref:Uncharacterized protein n=1 Tax=Sordaria brevicollis TaxID=83679 RepID=A0AAE0PH45_SORBR|nr:hypothetical protein B0T20DRAFT_350538 [Sordaria brevicollis]